MTQELDIDRLHTELLNKEKLSTTAQIECLLGEAELSESRHVFIIVPTVYQIRHFMPMIKRAIERRVWWTLYGRRDLWNILDYEVLVGTDYKHFKIKNVMIHFASKQDWALRTLGYEENPLIVELT